MKAIKIHKIIKTKRKTIALQITGNATLVVRAPITTSLGYIEKIVQKKKNWIEKKQKEILKRSERFVSKEFVDGEGFLYLGEIYKLKFVKNQLEAIVFNKKFFISKNKQNNAKSVLEDWYKSMALEKFTQRVDFFAKKSGFRYEKIKLSNAQTRWGSCSSNGNLNLSWNLIMTPLQVIDYVVVHELAHLQHKNHSPRFWTTIKVILPDYEKEKKWLKNNGHLLKI